MAQRLIDGGDILIEDGKIRSITDNSDYTPAPCDVVIDAKFRFVFPGFIDIYTHCGLDGTRTGDIYREEMFIAPYVHTSRYINAGSDDFSDKASCGITAVAVAPFSERIVGGKCCLIKTKSDDGKPNIVSEDCGTLFSLTGMSDVNYVVFPESIPSFIKSELYSASTYLSQDDGSALASPALSAYENVLTKKAPAYFSVCSDEQLKIAENIAERFSLNAVMLMDIRDAEFGAMPKTAPFVINPSHVGNAKRRLIAESIKDTDADFAISSQEADTLSVNAGLFVRSGLSMQSGFEAITTTPANLCGADDRIGSLSEGMDADIVIWNGNPLEVLSEVVYTIIDGKVAYHGRD